MTHAHDVGSFPARLVGLRVALVEDHALLVQSLRFAFVAEGAEVLAVDLADAAAVVADCLRYRPHVVLLDLDLGATTGDGQALIAPLVDAEIRVIVLTGSTDAARLGGCLEAGAVGLIEKTEDLDVLIEHVRRGAAGERLLPAQHRLDLMLESRRQRAARHHQLAPFESLTERENEVLAALICGRNVDEIAHAMFVSEATVRTHVRSILRKLDVRSQLSAVARARAAGWPVRVSK